MTVFAPFFISFFFFFLRTTLVAARICVIRGFFSLLSGDISRRGAIQNGTTREFVIKKAKKKETNKTIKGDCPRDDCRPVVDLVDFSASVSIRNCILSSNEEFARSSRQLDL